jgi:hypothetical protein
LTGDLVRSFPTLIFKSQERLIVRRSDGCDQRRLRLSWGLLNDVQNAGSAATENRGDVVRRLGAFFELRLQALEEILITGQDPRQLLI